MIEFMNRHETFIKIVCVLMMFIVVISAHILIVVAIQGYFDIELSFIERWLVSILCIMPFTVFHSYYSDRVKREDFLTALELLKETTETGVVTKEMTEKAERMANSVKS